MTSLWCLRQFSCIDQAGKVVDRSTKQGIGDAKVVAWRVRWDAPGHRGRSRTFTKKGYATATAAHTAARDFVDELSTAARNDWPCDDRGRPVAPTPLTATVPAGVPTPAGDVAAMTLEALGREWIRTAGGQPKTVQAHERSLEFALAHLPDQIPAEVVDSGQALQLLLARRYTPGPRAAKLVRMGTIHPDSEDARMCATQTEKVFLQDMKKIFEYGMSRKPRVVTSNPMKELKARQGSTDPVDPSLQGTFAPEEFTRIARRMVDRTFEGLVVLRGFTALRTGEIALATVDDIDRVNHVIHAVGTDGEAPRRLTGSGLSRTQNHLKKQPAGESRPVEYPDTPYINELVDDMVEEAHRRYKAYKLQLETRLQRYQAETGKQHLVADVEAKLHAHLNSAPRLVTMPDGSPFAIGRFDRDHWKPALHAHYPVEDPTHEDYNPLRETRFYNLRAAGIEFWIEDLDMDESVAAAKAGHSIEMQRRRYRRSREPARQRPEKLDGAASKVFDDLDG